MHEGWTQTEREAAYAGSRLKPTSRLGKAPSDRPAFQPYRGKPAVRNDRGDRGNVGIIRSPVRASVLPDWGARVVTPSPTRQNYALKSMDEVYAKLEDAALYIERNPALVKSITSFPYIAKSL